MTKKTIITGFLALIFFFSGHLFITAYTQYHISQKKLDVLRGQERLIKGQRKEFIQKKLTIDKVQAFMSQASALGLKQDQWDRFYIDLKEEGLSFSKLETILSQTASSAQYYFYPVSLEIRTGSQKAKAHLTILQENLALPATDAPQTTSTDPANTARPATPLQSGAQAGTQNLTAADLESFDAVISMEGHFLVNRRGLYE